MIIIDGKDLVLGRLASFAAKKLLEGEKVIVLNAEQVIISGRKEATLESYKAWLETRNIANPRKGPFHPKRPEDIVRRAVRGMLPYDKPKGMAAYRRLRVYVGVPEEFSGKEVTTVPKASLAELSSRRFIRVGELSRLLGGKF
ncbi:MAG: 50S ribosomal protein L13 [Candidatus Hadarchaeum yellowstonense]|jgi:large subunit ribosomal protein L13|uniref:Large ribosomal subunit protein uL13 n=1 Tax=Hadarchaeum yellowstonense TaxID=1776334 RepID=A0A147JSH8_HADYE|nr:MAG: 50S ribosomal protein L13 [Candidatus Hadarchaeum yellowstonense]